MNSKDKRTRQDATKAGDASSIALAEMLRAAICAARTAGKMLLTANSSEQTVEKVARRDIKLTIDRQAEETIIRSLRRYFPDHAILSEECGRIGGESDFLWIIDPLDGTFNYFRRIPIWCTSIALRHKKEEILGVIYDPNRGELFHAARGQGAFLNGRPIHVSKTPHLKSSVVGLAASVRDEFQEKALVAARATALHASKARSLGCAALDMAYVACGRLDAYFEFGVKEWDVAAGIVIIREASGKVSLRRHASPTLDIAVSNPGVHRQLLEVISWRQPPPEKRYQQEGRSS